MPELGEVEAYYSPRSDTIENPDTGTDRLEEISAERCIEVIASDPDSSNLDFLPDIYQLVSIDIQLGFNYFDLTKYKTYILK